MEKRLVPEDRIKMLYVHREYSLELMDDEAQMHYMIMDAGYELAKKLFEHKKHLIVKDGSRQTLTLKLEVIVPKGPPDAKPPATPV